MGINCRKGTREETEIRRVLVTTRNRLRMPLCLKTNEAVAVALFNSAHFSVFLGASRHEFPAYPVQKPLARHRYRFMKRKRTRLFILAAGDWVN